MRKVWDWFKGLFTSVTKISIAQKYYSVDGKLIDVIEKEYVATKIFTLKPTLIKLKTVEGKTVEIHTHDPMDFTLEEL